MLLCGCAPHAAMQELAAPLPSWPPPGQAVVVFVRPSSYARGDAFAILDERARLLGISQAATWFEARVSPGPHAFFADARNVPALRATLAPAKTYYVQVDASWAVFTVRVDLLAIAPRFERWQERDLWLAHSVGYQLIAPEQSSLDAERRHDIVARGLERLHGGYDANELDQRTLMPGDGT